MNYLTPTRPRFVCQIVRSSRALFENTGSSHVSACADCQAYFVASHELDQNLGRAAALLRRDVPGSPPHLVRSILQAVRAEKARVEPERARSRAPMWAMGAVVVAAAVAAFYFQRPMQFNSTATSSEDAAIAVVDAVETLSVRLTETLIPATGAMVANNPLQRELGSVYSDARSALNFLALNFLPPTSVSNPSPPPSTI
ncbi:MAG: hypothetical protein ABIZ81_13170 [Opitutaceae bacterium]